MRGRRRYKEFSSFAILLLGAMLLGNAMLAFISLVPLLFAVLSLSHPTPGDVRVERESYEIDAFKGDETVLRTRVHVGDGVGMVVVGDRVPGRFPLGSGSNFRVFWKGRKPLEAEMAYSVWCHRMGRGTVGAVDGEFHHFSMFGRSWGGEIGDVAEITVRPRPLSRKMLTDRRLRVPMPLPSTSKIGTKTTDFLEIRRYQPGDPYRDINWKATVRSGRDETEPLVNVFEKEGNRSVWIFLDGRRHMELGTTVDDAFEHGIQAAHALSRLYLARGCLVGLGLLGSGRLVVPDVGGRQENAIDNELKGAKMRDSGETLWQMMNRSRGHTVGQSPLIVVVTVVGGWNLDELVSCTRRAGRAYGRKTRAMVLHIEAHGIAAVGGTEAVAAALLSLGEVRMLRTLRKGATVYSWNPSRDDVITMLAKGEFK